MSALQKDVVNNPVKYGKLLVILVVVVIIIVLAINLAGGIGNALTSIKKLLGIASDPAADDARKAIQQGQSAATSPKSPWSSYYYDNAPGNAEFTPSDVRDMAVDNIYDSAGFFTVSASDGFSAIKTMPSKADISLLSKNFQEKEQRDLYTYMTVLYSSDTNVKIMKNILDYVNALPNYITV